MRHAVLLLALACGRAVDDRPNDVGPEVVNQVEVLVTNRALENVIVRACEGDACRPLIWFVGARTQGRATLTYGTDISLTLEVQYIGKGSATWRSDNLYWITPGICIEVDVRPFASRAENSVSKCRSEGDSQTQ
jgi:hypothetical protein